MSSTSAPAGVRTMTHFGAFGSQKRKVIDLKSSYIHRAQVLEEPPTASTADTEVSFLHAVALEADIKRTSRYVPAGFIAVVKVEISHSDIFVFGHPLIGLDNFRLSERVSIPQKCPANRA